MTIFVLTLIILFVANLVALRRGLRSDASRRPPRSSSDWGTADLPTVPYAIR